MLRNAYLDHLCIFSKSPYRGRGLSPSHTLPPLGRFAPSHISSKPPVAPKKLLLLLEPRLHAWHYKRLTNCRQHANIEIIYMYASEENCRVSAFKNLAFLSLVLLVLRIFCRYNMTFNREILGGGGGPRSSLLLEIVPCRCARIALKKAP